jgi:hypothetical protein
MSSRRDRARRLLVMVVIGAGLAGCKDPPAADRARGAGSSGAGSPGAASSGAGSAGAGSSGAASSGAGSADAPGASPRAVQLAAPGAIELAEPVIALPSLAAFVLEDAGAAPRRALRLHPAAGTATFTRTRALRQRQLDAHGAFLPSVALPELRDGFAVTAGDTGVLALRALPAEAASPSPEADAALDTWRRLLDGRRATVALDDRGQLGPIRFTDDPSNTHSEPARLALAAELLARIVPLPAEPVGVGARWRVVTILALDGAHAKQTATYTLLADGRVHAVIQRVAQEQRLATPGAPAGVTVDLVAMFRRHEGDVALDPARALIATGSFTDELRLHIRLSRPGAPPREDILETEGTTTFARGDR